MILFKKYNSLLFEFIIVTLLLALLFANVSAQSYKRDKLPVTNFWNDFDGNIGKEEVSLSLFFFKNGFVKGFFIDSKCENKIKVEGNVNDSTLILKELKDGKIIGYFKGIIQSDSFTTYIGFWTDSLDSNSVPFRFQRNGQQGGYECCRYTAHPGMDEAVEEFMKSVKKAIISGDKEWIVNHARFPLPYAADTKEELIKNFDSIFTNEYREYMKSVCPFNLFANWRGVALDGIWVEFTDESTVDNFELYISFIDTIKN